MAAWIDAFAGFLLRFGTVGLFAGPVVLVVALRWLLRIEKRAVLFWVSNAIIGLSFLMAIAGFIHPYVLTGPLAVPVVVMAAFGPLAVVSTLAALAFSTRAQRGLEILHVLCAYSCLVSLATLMVLASSSV